MPEETGKPSIRDRVRKFVGVIIGSTIALFLLAIFSEIVLGIAFQPIIETIMKPFVEPIQKDFDGWYENQFHENATPASLATIPSNTPTKFPTKSNPQTPTIPSTSTEAFHTPMPHEYTISITEVMANPCGETEPKGEPIWNEYVELYNYGDKPVDVQGLWLTDHEDLGGNPDKIVSWIKRVDKKIGNAFVNSTKIPAGGIALVLSPEYLDDHAGFNNRPYNIPDHTYVLTIQDGHSIGSDDHGIEVQNQQDSLTLYMGDSKTINYEVSSYSTPTILKDYFSAERKVGKGSPKESWQTQNWVETKNGTPGELWSVND